MALLEINDLQAFYPPLRALHGISFDVEAGGITTILGANGAGKTTTLRAICGMVRTQGTIRFAGEIITRRRTAQIARMGIAHVPDGRGTVVEFTVEENLRLGAYTRRDQAGIAADLDMLFDLFPKLRQRRQQQAGTLSGGEQQMLAIARALMLRPKLLLLDEPSFGVAPLLVQEIYRVLRRLNQEQRVSMLLVEQNANLALAIADQAHLLETGRAVLSDTAAALAGNATVRRSYLGF
jgi:branched-chain amino acid transport system ATP-binding protein